MNDQNSDIEETTSSDFMQKEVERLSKETVEYKDKYLRALAEAENARKRMQKEKQDLKRYAIEQIACDLLQPLDNLENALRYADSGSDEVRQWAHGFKMILTQFKDALAMHGIQPFESKGTPFDPHSHEAVETVETDEYPEGIVIEEYIRGYRLGDKTIRPARVKVAKKPIEQKEE